MRRLAEVSAVPGRGCVSEIMMRSLEGWSGGQDDFGPMLLNMAKVQHVSGVMEDTYDP